jgi:hypothetical protein
MTPRQLRAAGIVDAEVRPTALAIARLSDIWRLRQQALDRSGNTAGADAYRTAAIELDHALEEDRQTKKIEWKRMLPMQKRGLRLANIG